MKLRTMESNGIVTINTSLTMHNPRNIYVKSGNVGTQDPRFIKPDGTAKLNIRVSEEEKLKIRMFAEAGMTESRIAFEVGRSIGTVQKYKKELKKNEPKPQKVDGRKRNGGRNALGKHEIMGMIYMRYILHVPVKEIAVAFDRCDQIVYKYTNPSSVYVIESGVLTR